MGEGRYEPELAGQDANQECHLLRDLDTAQLVVDVSSGHDLCFEDDLGYEMMAQHGLKYCD